MRCITWQASGLGGLTIAGLWVLGVLAEIVVFALSPRFTLAPALLVVIGGLISSTVLTLLVLPAVYAWISGRGEEPTAAEVPEAPAT